MTKLRINVTKEVLEASKNCKSMASKNCAIAVAINPIFPDSAVGVNEFYPDCNCSQTIKLPLEAQQFISLFDKSTPDERILMTPFSFEIKIPNAVLEQINIDELKPLLENHPTLQLLNN